MAGRRWVLAATGLAALVAGALLCLGPPRVTLLNAALRIDYPWAQGAAALGAAGGAALVAIALPRRWARLAAAAVAASGLVAALGRLAYRLDANDAGLVCRGALSTTSVSWPQVSRVEVGPDVLVIWGSGETQIRIDTALFRPEQRAMLDRTIARHVRQGQPR